MQRKKEINGGNGIFPHLWIKFKYFAFVALISHGLTAL